jgi:uncharacterized membrane protein
LSDLIAVAYPDKKTADEVRETLRQLTVERVVELADAVIVTRDVDGKVRLHQSVHAGAAGATTGALWGGLIGLLFLAPLFGMAIGAVAGGATGALSDRGINDQFMKQLGEKLGPGNAALIVLVTKVTRDKVLPQIAQYGGEVIQTSLDDESEDRLRESLRASSAAAAA